MAVKSRDESLEALAHGQKRFEELQSQEKSTFACFVADAEWQSFKDELSNGHERGSDQRRPCPVDSSGCRTEFDVDQGSRAHGRDDSSGNFLTTSFGLAQPLERGGSLHIQRGAHIKIARYGNRGTRVGGICTSRANPTIEKVGRMHETWSPDCPHRRRLSTTVIPTRCLFCVNLFHSTGSMDWSTMSLTAMLFCLKCSSCQTEVCTERGVRSVTPQRDHHAGWCWSHIHQVPHHRTVSGREPGGGVEKHNRFSPLQDTQQEGRPIMESQRVRYRE